MTVKCAKEHIQNINSICEDINEFYSKHEDLQEETGFLIDAVAFLCDYRKALENAIENAEIRI